VFQRRAVVPAFAERLGHVGNRRTSEFHLDVMPRRLLSVLVSDRSRLWVTAVFGAIASPVTQIDPTDERDVVFRGTGMEQQHHLLVMRTTVTNAFVQQELPACLVDIVGEGTDLPFAEAEQRRMRTPQQAAHLDPPAAGADQEFAKGEAVGQVLTLIAPPVRDP